MKENESKLEITGAIRKKEEQEQTFEDILYILDDAIELKLKVELSVSNPPRGYIKTKIISPYEIKENHLCLTTDKGIGMAIELSRIKKATIVKEEAEE